MQLARPPSHLSGSQSSLASETGTSSGDPQRGTPPWPHPKGPCEYPAAASNPHPLPLPLPSPSPALFLSPSVPQKWKVVREVPNPVCSLSSGQALGSRGAGPHPACSGQRRTADQPWQASLPILSDRNNGVDTLSFTECVTFHPCLRGSHITPISRESAYCAPGNPALTKPHSVPSRGPRCPWGQSLATRNLPRS